MEDLIILQKTYDMIQYGYIALAQFPKSEKYALGTDIKSCMHGLLSLIITANKRYFKKTTLQDLDIEIARLKILIRLSQDLSFLPIKKYGIWSEMLVEIGRMTGGWIKSVK